MAAIELRNVTKKFATADGGTYTALKDLSLTVEDGPVLRRRRARRAAASRRR